MVLAQGRFGNPGPVAFCSGDARDTNSSPVCDASATSKDFLQRNLQCVIFQVFMVLVLQLLQFAGFLMDDLPRSFQKPATRFLMALRAHPNPTPNALALLS